MPALAELEAAWVEARDDAGFNAELGALLRDFAGRPTPLYLRASGCRSAVGPPVWLKREDLCTRARTSSTTRSARRCSPADGQAADHRRDRRRPARRRRPPPPARCSASSASSTWARGHAPPGAQRRSAWGCSARRVEPVDAGARTLKEAVTAAIRDWVANVADTHYIIGSCVGPAPYPRSCATSSA